MRPRNRVTMPIQIRAAAEPGRPPRFHRLRKVAVGAGLRPAPTDHRATILAFPEILRQSLYCRVKQPKKHSRAVGTPEVSSSESRGEREFGRPDGTRRQKRYLLVCCFPRVETRGYFRLSLRDMNSSSTRRQWGKGNVECEFLLSRRSPNSISDIALRE